MCDTAGSMSDSPLDDFRARDRLPTDAARPEAVAKRHGRGSRTARENLADLVDPDSFVEYGRLAVAAQRGRRDLDDLRANTPGDGVITGLATINAAEVGARRAATAVIINDQTVLAGTQGYFHHRKID
ncbi:MAG: carboxyl transferase domain-containing protein, partial [Myxococcota bacterium]